MVKITLRLRGLDIALLRYDLVQVVGIYAFVELGLLLIFEWAQSVWIFIPVGLSR